MIALINGSNRAKTPGSAASPNSTIDEEKCLVVPFKVGIVSIWSLQKYTPFGIVTISLLQIAFHFVSGEKLQKWLRFEPYNLKEIWRFVTYMLVHDDWLHLLLNVMMQLIFASFLEVHHSRYRVVSLYLIGGMSGVLGASCVHPDLVIGASAGVYALLISHIADILMNFETIKYKKYRCLCIFIIVLSDVIFNVIHVMSKDEPLMISWSAHITGGITGLFMGFAFYKKRDDYGGKRKTILFWTGLGFYFILMISLFILSLQIKKCTPFHIIRTRYIYFC